MDQMTESPPISGQAAPVDRVNGRWGDQGHAAKRLTFLDIRDVDLDRGQLHRDQCILESPARMRQSSSVDDEAVHPGAGIVDVVDQGAFVVGLERLDFQVRVRLPSLEQDPRAGAGWWFRRFRARGRRAGRGWGR